MAATVAALVGEAIHSDELRASIESTSSHLDATASAACSGAVAAGDIRDDIDLELVGPIPSAIIYQRLLITHEPVDDTVPERIVDELMLPLLT